MSIAATFAPHLVRPTWNSPGVAWIVLTNPEWSPVFTAATAPNWADKLTAISSAVAAGGVVIAAIGAWLAFGQVKEVRRDRHIQVLSEFTTRWDSEDVVSAREEQLKYDKSTVATELKKWVDKSETPTADVALLLRVPNFFEDMAIMVECGSLELEYVKRAWGQATLRMWAYWKPAVQELRGYSSTAYTEFEKLAQKLEKAGAKLD